MEARLSKKISEMCVSGVEAIWWELVRKTSTPRTSGDVLKIIIDKLVVNETV
jgi:hypothetical protein